MSSDRIIIAGAGPAGLGLALALAKERIPVMVLEARDELSRDPRGSTFHPPTLEMIKEWGLLARLENHGVRCHKIQYWDRTQDQLIAELDLGLLAKDTPCPYRLHSPQYRLCNLLFKELERFNGEVLFGHRLLDFEQTADEVVVRVKHRDKSKKIKGAFLCGADGFGSAVRKHLNVGFAKNDYQDVFLTVELEDKFGEVFEELETNSGTAMARASVHFHDHDWGQVTEMPHGIRILYRLTPEQDPAHATEPKELARRLSQIFGKTVKSRYRHSGVYMVHSRLAETLHRGRVFLLGDAAHVINPVGGAGLNSALHDAYHLADALRHTARGGANDLLSRYSSERFRDMSKYVQRYADESYKVMCATGPWDANKRNAFLKRIASDENLSRAHLMRLSLMEHRLKDPMVASHFE